MSAVRFHPNHTARLPILGLASQICKRRAVKIVYMTHLIQAENIRDECRVVWLEAIEPLDYVRQSLVPCSRRKGRMRWPVGRVVGYAELNSHACRDSGQDYFFRRIFWLKVYDRDSGDPTYRRGTPIEAVDPRTVSPGEPGRCTSRAWNGPPTPHKLRGEGTA
jgi:hypothetical protein